MDNCIGQLQIQIRLKQHEVNVLTKENAELKARLNKIENLCGSWLLDSGTDLPVTRRWIAEQIREIMVACNPFDYRPFWWE